MGRSTSVRRASAAGLFPISKPSGVLPPTSPAKSGRSRRAARASDAATVGSGKHRRPSATAVTAVVIARTTSTATMAYPLANRASVSRKHATATVPLVCATALPPLSSPRWGRGTHLGTGQPQALLRERVRVEPAAIDLDSQQLLQPDVA